LMAFRNGQVQFLIATDVAARGLDVPSISHVFNYGLPMKSEDYVHRIGLTGRAGRDGLAVTFAEFRDRRKIFDIESYTKQPLKAEVIPGLEPSQRSERPRGFDDKRQAPRGRGRGAPAGGGYGGGFAGSRERDSNSGGGFGGSRERDSNSGGGFAGRSNDAYANGGARGRDFNAQGPRGFSEPKREAGSHAGRDFKAGAPRNGPTVVRVGKPAASRSFKPKAR